MLKIDKSFIDGIDSSPEDRAIVEHVVGMADALGMKTVAEGVERPEQLAWLRRLGCRLAQGYTLSRPLPADELEELVRKKIEEPFEIGPVVPHAGPRARDPPPAAQLGARHQSGDDHGPAASTYFDTRPHEVAAPTRPRAGPSSRAELPGSRLGIDHDQESAWPRSPTWGRRRGADRAAAAR